MTERAKNIAVGVLLAVIFIGYTVYLAHLYTTTGGHW